MAAVWSARAVAAAAALLFLFAPIRSIVMTQAASAVVGQRAFAMALCDGAHASAGRRREPAHPNPRSTCSFCAAASQAATAACETTPDPAQTLAWVSYPGLTLGGSWEPRPMETPVTRTAQNVASRLNRRLGARRPFPSIIGGAPEQCSARWDTAMTMISPTAQKAAIIRQRWPDYRAVWRWHFYAGLLCIPFVLWLCATGSIYLFKPQVEAWLDRPFAALAVPRDRVAPSAEVMAALEGEPGSSLHGYQLPRHPGDAAQILVGRGDGEVRVWVDPRSAKILKAVAEDRRFMQTIFHLHGELLLGDRGSLLVELAASWAIVMILTGLFLWWPRKATGLGGVLYPRLNLGRAIFWRDLHAVCALWISATTLLLLASGLPWATSWGAYLHELRSLSGAVSIHQDWTTGRSSELAKRAALSAAGSALKIAPSSDAMAGMKMDGAAREDPPPHARVGYDALDRLVPTVVARRLAFPVIVAPPSAPGGGWSARSEAQDRPRRVTLTLDGLTGKVLSEERFDQHSFIDRAVGVGVAAHEGQLFGWPNQALNLGTAAGLMTASLTAPLLWWRRRRVGLGAPPPIAAPRFSGALLSAVAVLGLLLPLFGASLMAVLVAERLVFRNIAPVRDWLGLQRPAQA